MFGSAMGINMKRTKSFLCCYETGTTKKYINKWKDMTAAAVHGKIVEKFS